MFIDFKEIEDQLNTQGFLTPTDYKNHSHIHFKQICIALFEVFIRKNTQTLL